ncbi:hypothetical protein EI555_012820, partial [Monodon monoceros]
LVGAVVPSPGRERRHPQPAPSEGADYGASRAFRGLPFTPPPPEEAPPGDAGPAPGGRVGYLKRGESFRHSSKSTVIFILPPPRLASGAGRAEGAAGAAALGTQTATAGARPRLALRRAAEGASPAGHSSREDSGGSDGSFSSPALLSCQQGGAAACRSEEGELLFKAALAEIRKGLAGGGRPERHKGRIYATAPPARPPRSVSGVGLGVGNSAGGRQHSSSTLLPGCSADATTEEVVELLFFRIPLMGRCEAVEAAIARRSGGRLSVAAWRRVAIEIKANHTNLTTILKVPERNRRNHAFPLGTRAVQKLARNRGHWARPPTCNLSRSWTVSFRVNLPDAGERRPLVLVLGRDAAAFCNRGSGASWTMRKGEIHYRWLDGLALGTPQGKGQEENLSSSQNRAVAAQGEQVMMKPIHLLFLLDPYGAKPLCAGAPRQLRLEAAGMGARPQRPQDRGRRRTEQVGGSAGAGRRCWVGGGPAAGEGPEPLPLTGAGTAQLGLGGAVSANGSVARAEPPRLPASGQPEGAAALRLARTRGCRRAWRVGAGESLASPVSDRAFLSETGTRAVCALLGEGLEPRGTLSSFELCEVFSNQSAKICPESSDTKSLSNPAREPTRRSLAILPLVATVLTARFSRPLSQLPMKTLNFSDRVTGARGSLLFHSASFVPVDRRTYTLLRGGLVIQPSGSWVPNVGSDLLKQAASKAVLVTGCDSGFGFSLAKHRHSKGFLVFAGYLM